MMVAAGGTLKCPARTENYAQVNVCKKSSEHLGEASPESIQH